MLIGNYTVLNKTPGRWLSGGSAAGTNQAQARSNFGRTGPARGVHYGDGETTARKTLGYPLGGYDTYAWMMPYVAGEMSSRYEADFSIAAAAQGVMGLPGEGSASFSVTAADLEGQLLALGSGSASFSVTTNSPLLTAVVNGAGSASFSVTTNNPLLGALADISGTASIVFTVTPADILPEDDSPPLREGSASFSVTATLVPYAIGHMEGSTVDTTGMTPATVARAVWSALTTQFNEAGTMGQALNGAGAAGDPWIADLDGYAAGSAGAVIRDLAASVAAEEVEPGTTLAQALQALLAVAVGKAAGGGGPTITFRDKADSRDAVVMTVDSNGNRTNVVVNQ